MTYTTHAFGTGYAVSLILLQGLLCLPSAMAMPMFARKYKADCMMCHAAVPRLNFAGTKFKAAGYRMPWEIDKDQDESVLKLENYTSFISVVSARVQVQKDHASDLSTTTLTSGADELHIHPITGSWDKHWGSGFELGASSSGSVTLSQGFLTYTSGSPDSFGTIQVGIIPNFLGYSVLDRPIAASSPLILSQTTSNSGFDSLFSWTGPRAAGLTGTYWIGDTDFSASIRNRLVNGSSGIDAIGALQPHMGDLFLSAAHFFDQTGAGSAVTAFFYKGLSQIPKTTGGASNFGNSFNHLGLAANKYLSEEWNAFTGGGWNADQNGTTGEALHSFGTFVGAEYFRSPKLMTGLRIDHFRSDTATPETQTLGAAVYSYWHVINWVILSAEYRINHFDKNTLTSAGINNSSGSTDQHVFTVQAMATF